MSPETPSPLPYPLMADAVMLLHFGIVVFVVGGLVAIAAGNLLGWRWVNRLMFRLAHLAAIVTVVAESWAGITCPLTTLESWLRQRAGEHGYSGGGFIETWVQGWLYHDLPAAWFTLAYTAFGLAVAAAWWAWPPVRRRAAQA